MHLSDYASIRLFSSCSESLQTLQAAARAPPCDGRRKSVAHSTMMAGPARPPGRAAQRISAAVPSKASEPAHLSPLISAAARGQHIATAWARPHRSFTHHPARSYPQHTPPLAEREGCRQRPQLGPLGPLSGFSTHTGLAVDGPLRVCTDSSVLIRFAPTACAVTSTVVEQPLRLHLRRDRFRRRTQAGSARPSLASAVWALALELGVWVAEQLGRRWRTLALITLGIYPSSIAPQHGEIISCFRHTTHKESPAHRVRGVRPGGQGPLPAWLRGGESPEIKAGQ